MNDKKLTDEEIIKRLEQCVKRGNRNYDTDMVLDLIKRQKAEIEELKEKFTLDFEKMESEYDGKIKAEAYKECIEKVIETAFLIEENAFQDCYVISKGNLDNLLKEMVGVNNE